jgi:hypothetical protein
MSQGFLEKSVDFNRTRTRTVLRMNSFMPRLDEYPISNFGSGRVRRSTPHEISVRLAAERWTLRSRPRRSH